MRHSFAVLILATTLAGCASAPPAAQDPGPGTASAHPDRAPGGVAGGATAEKVAATPRVPAGYRAATHDGVFVFCKDVQTLGSRFKKEICMTPEQYKEHEASNERNRQNLRKAIGICSGGTGYGSCSGG